MKAAVVREFGGGFQTEDVTIADPVGREVLVEVKASGLCHSDDLAASTNLGYDVPMVLGHEVAGVVTAVGDQVRDCSTRRTTSTSRRSNCSTDASGSRASTWDRRTRSATSR
jgi:Zn-dependent alcohol dehydrogenase